MADDTEDYQTVHVTGLGDLKFPSSLDDDEIEAAIKQHPGYQKAAEFNKSITGKVYNTLDSASKAIVNPLNKAIDAVPGLRPAVDFGTGLQTSLYKGVPVAGRYVPQTEKQTEFEKNHPIANTAARATGAITSAIPIIAASEALGPAALGGQMLTQAGIWGGLGVADKIAEKGKNVTAGELAKTFAIDAPLGGAGPLLGRALSPASKVKVPVKKEMPPLDTYTETFKRLRPINTELKPWQKATPAAEQLDALIAKSKQEAKKATEGIVERKPPSSLDEVMAERHEKRVADTFKEHYAQELPPKVARVVDILSDVAGTGIGYLSHDLVGGVLGHYAGREVLSPAVKMAINSNLARKYYYNQLGHSPYTKAVIQGLLGARYSGDEEIDERE